MDPYLGEIRLFGGTYAPVGWLLCQGQSLSISEYTALYSLLGVTYGGDARITFNLPDLRGLLTCGTGQGAGLTNNYALGQSFGTATVTLTPAQMPGHTHGLLASTLPADNAVPTSRLFAVPASPVVEYLVGTPSGGSVLPLDADMLLPAGENGAHSNLMPTVALSYIICTQGIFPASN